jgi:hypothetical protein
MYVLKKLLVADPCPRRAKLQFSLDLHTFHDTFQMLCMYSAHTYKEAKVPPQLVTLTSGFLLTSQGWMGAVSWPDGTQEGWSSFPQLSCVLGSLGRNSFHQIWKLPEKS